MSANHETGGLPRRGYRNLNYLLLKAQRLAVTRRFPESPVE